MAVSEKVDDVLLIGAVVACRAVDRVLSIGVVLDGGTVDDVLLSGAACWGNAFPTVNTKETASATALKYMLSHRL